MQEKTDIYRLPFKDSPSISQEVSQLFWEADQLRGIGNPPSLDDIERPVCGAPDDDDPPDQYE